jgi:alpha-tubulin suppressor-like RCC1 family protein
MAAGTDFTCALLDDTSVRCWGAGNRGQLGAATAVSTTLPGAAVQVFPPPPP